MITYEGFSHIYGEIMTPEIEGLRLMCLFMGGEIDDGVYHILNSHDDVFNYVKGKAYFDEMHGIPVAYLTYSSSYNQLIEVWKKFRDLEFSPSSTEVLEHLGWKTQFEEALAYKSCEEAFLLLVEAIKWYNSLTPKTED